MPENDPRDLPGFIKKSFALPFAGGEIWFEHLDGIYGYTSLVLEKLAGDIPQFVRPSAPANICVMLDETDITDDLIGALVEALTMHGKRFMRAAFVGVDKRNRRAKKEFSKRLYGRGFAIAFFSDTEKAKEWLISEGN